MRNGNGPDLDSKAVAAEEHAPGLDQLSIDRAPAPAPLSKDVGVSPAQDLDSTSFSFSVERAATAETVRATRVKTFPKLEPEAQRELDSNPLVQRQSREKDLGKSSSNSSKSARTARLKIRGGMKTLLDKYISFLAAILKKFERFLLRRFNRQAPEARNSNSSQVSREPQDSTTLTQSENERQARIRRQPSLRGPGI